MNRASWLIAVIVLAMLAWAVTSRVMNGNPRERWQVVPESPGGTGKPEPDEPEPTVVAVREVVPATSLEELWESSLFRPERSESLASGEDGAPETSSEPFLLELVAVGMYGDKRAAIINVQSNTAARSVRTVPAGLRLPGAAPAPPDEGEPEGPKRKVFREGDTVGDTGYEVVEIRFSEVVLSRGGEERVIKLEAEDETSESRRAAAARVDARRRAIAESRARAEAASARTEPDKPQPDAVPDSPPPPPPVPVVPNAGTPSRTTGEADAGAEPAVPVTPRVMTPEERLKRAQEIRERLLKLRSNTTNQ